MKGLKVYLDEKQKRFRKVVMRPTDMVVVPK